MASGATRHVSVWSLQLHSDNTFIQGVLCSHTLPEGQSLARLTHILYHTRGRPTSQAQATCLLLLQECLATA